MTDLYIGISLTVIGVLMSALYSGLETGLYTINKVRLDTKFFEPFFVEVGRSQ